MDLSGNYSRPVPILNMLTEIIRERVAATDTVPNNNTCQELSLLERSSCGDPPHLEDVSRN
jgi:hypothetical protein